MISIILFGSPGSGKGTQSKYLIEEFDFNYIPLGDILRKAILKKTVLGLKISEIVKSGNLISDELCAKIIQDYIKDLDSQKGFLFDGFPRTLNQCISLDTILKSKNQAIKQIAVHLETTPENAINRLLKRASEENRIDDNKKVIKKRLSLYNQVSSQVLDYYQNHHSVLSVNGNQLEKVVKNNIFLLVRKFLKTDKTNS